MLPINHLWFSFDLPFNRWAIAWYSSFFRKSRYVGCIWNIQSHKLSIYLTIIHWALRFSSLKFYVCRMKVLMFNSWHVLEDSKNQLKYFLASSRCSLNLTIIILTKILLFSNCLIYSTSTPDLLFSRYHENVQMNRRNSGTIFFSLVLSCCISAVTRFVFILYSNLM